MTMQEYKSIRESAQKAMAEAKKQYEQAIAEQKKLVSDVQRKLANDNVKYKPGSKVLRGKGKTVWTVEGFHYVIVDDHIGYFYTLEPEKTSRFRTAYSVYENELTQV